jgi:hypothetical protein
VAAAAAADEDDAAAPTNSNPDQTPIRQHCIEGGNIPLMGTQGAANVDCATE